MFRKRKKSLEELEDRLSRQEEVVNYLRTIPKSSRVKRFGISGLLGSSSIPSGYSGTYAKFYEAFDNASSEEERDKIREQFIRSFQYGGRGMVRKTAEKKVKSLLEKHYGEGSDLVEMDEDDD